MRYYLAYGSNLSVEQMAYRCPDAIYVGTGELKDMRLEFHGVRNYSYLTVEPFKGGTVPVVVWRVSAADEKSLDRYEGYPKSYYKQDINIKIHSLLNGKEIGKRHAFLYKMCDGRGCAKPSDAYWNTCLDGYEHFGFDVNLLFDAYDLSLTKEAI